MTEALRCSACGASLPTTTPELASLVCPSCGSVNRIAGELLEALHTHRREVDGYRQQSAHAAEQALISQVTQSFGGGWAALFVVSWLLAGVAVIPKTPLAYLIATAVFLAPLLAIIGLSRRRLQRFRAQAEAARTREQRVPVHCPTCGGQSELLPEQPVLPCRYCSGARAARAAALAELIAVARASAEREQRLALHQRWRLAAHTNRDQRTDLVPLFVIGGLGALLASASVAAAVRSLFVTGGPGLGELAVMFTIGLVVIAAPGVPLLIRRRRRLSMGARIEALAARAGATLRRDPASFAAWLIEHWTGEFSARQICAGLGYAFVASSTPLWALSLAPEAQQRGVVERHLRVLICGRATGSLVRSFAARLESLGFRCESDQGGVIATLPLPELDEFLARPDGIEQLAAALATNG